MLTGLSAVAASMPPDTRTFGDGLHDGLNDLNPLTILLGPFILVQVLKPGGSIAPVSYLIGKTTPSLILYAAVALYVFGGKSK